MTIDRIHGSAPWNPEGLRIHKLRQEREAWDRETAAMLQKLQSDLNGAQAEITKLRQLHVRGGAAVARNDALIKSVRKREAERHLDRQADGLRKALRRAQHFRKNGRLAKLPPRDRWPIEEAEVAARKALMKIEAQRQARRSINQDAEKYRRARVERGVTFDRMMSLS